MKRSKPSDKQLFLMSLQKKRQRKPEQEQSQQMVDSTGDDLSARSKLLSQHDAATNAINTISTLPVSEKMRTISEDSASRSSNSTFGFVNHDFLTTQNMQKEIQSLKQEVAEVKRESKVVTHENGVLREMIHQLQNQVDDLKKIIGEVENKATSTIGEVKRTMIDRYRTVYPDEPVIEAEMIGEDLQFILNFGEEVIPPYNLKELFRQVVECPKPVSVALKKFVRKMISEVLSVEVQALYSVSNNSPKFASFPVAVFKDLRDKLFFCLPVTEQNEDLRQFLQFKLKDVLNDMFKEARSKVKTESHSSSPPNGY